MTVPPTSRSGAAGAPGETEMRELLAEELRALCDRVDEDVKKHLGTREFDGKTIGNP